MAQDTQIKPDAAWDENLLRDPHHVADKRRRVQKMFAAIAPSYDLNNRLHSLWQDQRWRAKAVKIAALAPGDSVVDVACGTGDLSIGFGKALWDDDDPMEVGWCAHRVIGIDFTFEMLSLARIKGLNLPRHPKLDRPLCPQIKWVNGDAQSLPLAEESANVVSIAFGIRNVQNPIAALREFHRVLRPGGRVIILEFSLPTNALLRSLYNFYFRKVLPRTATRISGDKTGAYKYLPESVNTFIGREQMVQMMRGAGFQRVEQFPMTFGVCVCYRGYK